jgi:hypothetical protein
LIIDGDGSVKLGGVTYQGAQTTPILNKFKVGRPYLAETFVGAGTNSIFTNWVTAPVNIGHNTNNWVQKSKLPFIMQPNMTITAKFNPDPYPAVLGKYNGLAFEDAGVAHESSGYIQITVKKKAGYSGSMVFDGNKLKFSGKLTADGTATTTINRTLLGKDPLQVTLAVDWGNEKVTGQITNGTWTSEIDAHKQVFFPDVGPFDTTNDGDYTFQLPSDLIDEPAGPIGVSFAWMTNSSAGIVKYGGQFADGSKFTGKMNISRDGSLPFYVGLYKNVQVGPNEKEFKGSVLGWINFELRNFEGVNNLSWIKTGGTESIYQTNYAAGFTNFVPLVGSPYVPPAPETLPIPIAVGNRIIVSDGGLTQPVTNWVTAVVGAKVILSATNDVAALNKAMISFKGKDGTVSGSFLQTPGDSLTKRITKGVVLQNGPSAAGHFVGAPGNGSGTLTLEQD